VKLFLLKHLVFGKFALLKSAFGFCTVKRRNLNVECLLVLDKDDQPDEIHVA
jgi:hypothetical protein